jgi:hypothetical protein
MTYKIGAQPSLNKEEMLRLARISRQNFDKSRAQGERVARMAELRRQQMVRDFESEYDQLRAASFHAGPLHRAALTRIADLKAYI